MDLEKIRRRMLWVGVILLLLYAGLYIRLALVQRDPKVQTAAGRQGTYTLRVGSTYGNIYDRNLEPLTNRDTEYLAAVIPTDQTAAVLKGHVPEGYDLAEQLRAGKPFVCPVDSEEISGEDVLVFSVPVRYGESRLAQHLMGYALEGEGVCGLESAYQQLLRQDTGTNQVVYQVNGQGELLAGSPAKVTPAEPVKTGVVTTLDRDIQQICEDAAQQMERGAVVVMDVHSGDILAMVSRPDFDPAALGEALRSENSPFVNRALNAYSVGSIFKLAIAASAIQNGISPGYSYQCTGMTQIYGQMFRCHRHSGHGIQNMIDATANSCNTYFISLVQQLSVKQMLETVSALGFGRETILCSSPPWYLLRDRYRLLVSFPFRRSWRISPSVRGN
ncbi:penicillin-binding transpeptidase domain-containing protein [Ruminococcus champanellensis]|uniref:penicillin-binding transpeptidase domain-containing protein n=1 Tax=Ruminococcus champanellensis TaxID=1161942 RepID=UPI002E77D36C|nr:penicillin-binding transpeptidase domain-containing protein [Ruminococcus champanellensis]MED9890733.1 penicillin-binding transpeptidase domain-containing protein [Ruminococcus champanellensis]